MKKIAILSLLLATATAGLASAAKTNKTYYPIAASIAVKVELEPVPEIQQVEPCPDYCVQIVGCMVRIKDINHEWPTLYWAHFGPSVLTEGLTAQRRVCYSLTGVVNNAAPPGQPEVQVIEVSTFTPGVC